MDEEMIKQQNYCLITKLLKILGTEWTAHIVLILAEEKSMRHNQLKTHLTGISSKVLTERLRLLEAENFIERIEESESSNSVSYRLSESGLSLHGALEHIEAVCVELQDTHKK